MKKIIALTSILILLVSLNLNSSPLSPFQATSQPPSTISSTTVINGGRNQTITVNIVPNAYVLINIAWEIEPGVAVDGYNVYRSTTMVMPSTPVNSTPLKTTVFTDYVYGTGTPAYYYVVRAVQNGVESPSSNMILVTN